MHFRTRTWFIISLLCFVAAAIFWQLGQRAERQRDLSLIEAAKTTNTPSAAPLQPQVTPPTGPVSPSPAVPAVPSVKTNSANAVTPAEFPHRLTNTPKDVETLSRSEQAILLANALIDSAGPVQLPIPPHLKATGDPGSYIVQARGLVTDEFRAKLGQAGAEIVSYIPNNAYLVRASAAAAKQLEAQPETQTVLPWEPYYKLEAPLLAQAVEQKPLLGGSPLTLLLFPGARENVLQELARLGVTVTGEERSVFGPTLAVRVPPDALIPIAALAGVHLVEYHRDRKAASDITRARVRVSTNTVVADNYLGLTGAGVLVNVNDTGIDAMHPALSGRVDSPDPFSLEDPYGHGTHVAGILAGDGANGPTGTNTPPGSVTNASYRGMAPAARLLALPIDPIFSLFQSDTLLQETAASSNAFISNNSWTYAGAAGYTLAAANWDAAARDALPGVSGAQPLALVFAAGNSDPSLGSGSSRISAPGTAKNVITVGAIENYRLITNIVTVDGNPGQPFLEMTDSSNQVANFSARGNVGIGTEGLSGRFKPDVVAPGTMIVSTRSGQFVDPTGSDSFIGDLYPNEVIPRMSTNVYQINVPPEGIRLFLIVSTNILSPDPFPQTFIHARQDEPPTSADLLTPLFPNFAFVDTPNGGYWYYSVGNTNNFDLHCLVRAVIQVTNDTGDYFEVLAGLNAPLGPYYRYESGTSQSAPVVSGMLALMQQRLALTNTPALMKALLINGARTLGTPYDFRVTNTLNQQGWGLPNLTNSLPMNGLISGDEGNSSGSVIYYPESPARALITGQSFTRTINVSALAQNSPLRVTLVWTDPPGNPAVGIKLVNDLDLIVTNLTTGQVFVGNNFSLGNEFVSPSATNFLGSDNINNVENVFINRRLDANYSITVRARRVNVNAVTSQTNGVAQDFALVISTDRPAAAGALTLLGNQMGYQAGPLLQTVTNGVPLLNQRVGANNPMLSSTNGVTNQWSFYIVTNALPPTDPGFTNGGTAQNIAFITFLAPNLSLPRVRDSDIDLYVSENPAITNLDAAAIASSFRSTSRGGTEAVVLTNVMPGTIYYAGVKSEDQQAANFGFFALSRSTPFSVGDEEGNIVAEGFPVPMEIPDAEDAEPKAAIVFALVTQTITVQNVVVTNGVTHENISDLLGVLSHASPGEADRFAVLNNNRSDPPSGSVQWVFDDSDSGRIVSSIPTDTPGTLRNFVGEEGIGVWQLTMIDNSSFYTGQVDRLVIQIQPQLETNGGSGVFGTILPNRWLYVPVEVTADATNLYACAAPQNGAVEVYVRREGFPSRQVYDNFAIIIPPGDCLNIGRRDAPPLSAGRYIVGYYNPNSTTLDFYHREGVDRDLSRSGRLGFRSTNSVAILDEAVTNSFIHVTRNQLVADLQVGVRIDHERVSDLVLHLTSPAGTRVLLTENRGGPNAANFGYGSLQTNVFGVSSTGGPDEDSRLLGPVDPEGTLQVDYDFFQAPDRLTVYYEGEQIFDSGLVSGAGTFAVDYGPGSDTNISMIINEGGNPNPTTQWGYTATVLSGYHFAFFADDTNIAHLPIKFAPPDYTNNNYSVTNVFTNSVVLEDGFENATVPTVAAPGMISGWTVDSGVVHALTAATGTNGITPDTGFYYARLEGSPVPTRLLRDIPTVPGLDYQVTIAVATNVSEVGSATLNVVASDNAGGATTFTYAPPSSGALWTLTSFVFTATGPTTELSLTAGTNDFGVLVDSVKVEQVRTKVVTGIAFQPAESLSPFKGENAFGDWNLEVWDNRIGGTVSNGVLLAWKLNIAFVSTNPPVVRLTNAVASCGTLASNEVAYFVVNVPISAQNATNLIVASDKVDLIFNQFGLPSGTLLTDAFFATNVTSAVTVLDTDGWNTFTTNTPPRLIRVGDQELQPGRRYYLAVRNRSRGTNDFCLTVTFDRLDPDLVEVIPITNRCVISQALSTNLLDYFQVDLPTNALEVTFTLTPSAQLGLVANPGLPLPNPTSYYRKSDDPLNLVETITVTDFTGNLLPGRWYLGVYNTNSSMAGVPYDLCVSVTGGEVIDLGPGGTYTNRLDSPLSVDYYTITVLSNACSASFCAFPTNGDVDIYVARDLLSPLNAVPTNAVYFSTNGLAGESECLEVTTGSGVQPLTAGTWVMAVVNRSAGPVDYRVALSQTVDCFKDYTLLVNRIPRCDVMATANEVDYYQFTVANNVVQAVFETLNASTNVDLYVRYAQPAPFPGPGNFDYASIQGGNTNEFIPVLRNSPVPLAPGSWFLAVSNASLTTNVSYCVRASQLASNEIVALTNAVSTCRSVSPGVGNIWNSGVQFFSFAASSNALQSVFELYNLSGDADLYVQYGLPVTNFTAYAAAPGTYPYVSSHPGTTREYLCVSTDSTPVAWTGGPWYVAVVNRGTTPVSFCLRATELKTNTMTRFDPVMGGTICTNVARTNVSVLDGIDYYVLPVREGAVAVSIETFGADGDVDLYVQRGPCLPNFASLALGPTNYPYASTNSGTNSEWICVTTNSSPVGLAPGDWFIAVVNRGSAAKGVNYCLRTTVIRTNDIQVLAATPDEFYRGVTRCVSGLEPQNSTNTAAGIDYFAIDVPTNAVLLEIETYNATGNIDLFVQSGPCFPLTALGTRATNYLYASTHLGRTNEILWVTTNSAPVPLTNGLWYVAVMNRENGNVNYCLRTRFLLDTDLPRLENGVASCSRLDRLVTEQDPRPPAGHGGIDYYVFHVSSNAIFATFEAWSTNGNVDLYVQYGPCLTNYETFRGAVTNYPYLSTNIFTNTSLAFYPYASTNLGTNAEAICIPTNSLPVPLQAGDWYLAVVNRTTNGGAADYCVRAIEVLNTQITELVNRTPYFTNVVVTNGVANVGVDYYHYRVPSNVVQIDVELYALSGNADLYVTPGPCWIDPLRFPYSSTRSSTNADMVSVALNSTPVALTPGDWYFAVVNHDPIAQPVFYAIRLTEFPTNNIILLTNCETVVRSGLNPSFFGISTGIVADFYVFNVSTNAVQAVFEIYQTLQDVNLYIHRGLPLPVPNRFDYASTNAGMASEWVIVSSNSAPVALAPGPWYLTVVNPGVVDALYAIRAYEVTTPEIVPLRNAVPINATVEARNTIQFKPAVDYYSFHVSTNAIQADFKVFDLSGDVDLYLARNPLPSDTNFLVSSISVGTLDEIITLTTNSTVRLTPGDWYLTIWNHDFTPVSYSVCATEHIIGASDDSGIIRLHNGVAVANTITELTGVPGSGQQYYLYQVSTNAVQANFELFDIVGGDVNLYLRRGLPLPSPALFDASSVNGGDTNEWISLNVDNGPLLLAPGDWYLTVANASAFMLVDYQIRVTEFSIGGSGSNSIPRLAGGQCLVSTNLGTNTQSNPRIDYYVFNVSSNAVRAQMEILAPSGNVELIVGRGTPLPVFDRYDAISARPGVCEELVTLFRDGATGVVLAPGDWFIGVVNATGNPITYTVCAREYAEWGTNMYISSILVVSNTPTSNSLCLTLTNLLPEASYYFEGKSSLSTPAWAPASPTLRATASSATWCTPVPPAFHFFRARQGLAPKATPPQNFTTVVTNGTVVLHWTGQTNQQFLVEWTPAVVPSNWRPLTPIVTSTTGQFEFIDDGSQTGGPATFRFYRIIPLQ